MSQEIVFPHAVGRQCPFAIGDCKVQVGLLGIFAEG